MPYRWLLSISVALAVVVGLSVTPSAGAGQDQAEEPAIRAEELPISLERIRRKLDSLPESDDERFLLRLSFYVEVYGRAPQINPLEGFDVHNGPVPYGAPAHADMRAITTPQEFRAPAANLGNVLGWIWKKAGR